MIKCVLWLQMNFIWLKATKKSRLERLQTPWSEMFCSVVSSPPQGLRRLRSFIEK